MVVLEMLMIELDRRTLELSNAPLHIKKDSTSIAI